MTDDATTTAVIELAAAGPSADVRPRRGDARRLLLIETTTRMASRNGVVATSVKDIAHAAGVAPGLVHYYFASKEELLVAVVARLEGELRATWRRGVDAAEDPLERLIAGLDAIADEADSHPERRRLLADLAVSSLSSPQIHERVVGLWRLLTADIEGELRSVLGALPAYSLASPRDLAAVLSGAVDGIVVQALVVGDSPRAAFHTLSVMVLSVVATAYLLVGETPPLARLRALAAR